MAQMVKNLPAMQETRVRSLGQEDPLENEMATHSSILSQSSQEERNLVGYSQWGHKSWTPLSDSPPPKMLVCVMRQQGQENWYEK